MFRGLGRNSLICSSEASGERKSAGGIVIPDDDGTDSGIRPRWCQVYDVGAASVFKDDLQEGDWILVAHGRWTQGVEVDGETIWKIDPDGVLLQSDEHPDGI